MSPVDQLRLSHRVADAAIAEIMRQDPRMKRDQAASLLAHAAVATIRGARGSEVAAEAAYAIADAMVVTPG